MNTRTGIVPALGARVAAHGAALAAAAQGRRLFTPGRERARLPHRHRSASHALPESRPVWVAVWERSPARATISSKHEVSRRRYGGGNLRRAGHPASARVLKGGSLPCPDRALFDTSGSGVRSRTAPAAWEGRSWHFRP